jgi:MFS family permease
LGAPIITPLTARWHRYQRQMIWTGWIICILSLVAASFAKTVWQLILTQGLGYGVGFLILYYAILSMLNEWFVERRGLAYGILFAAAGLSGTGLPYLTEYLLHQLGYPNTLRLFALSMLVLVGATLPFCRGRLPPSDENSNAPKIAWRSTFKNPIFYFLSVSNLFQGLSFYLPFFYVVLYATSLGITSSKGILLFCMLNLSQVVGQIAIGWLSDCADIFLLLVASNIGSIIACVLWLTATGFDSLMFFAVLYGLFAGGYSVLVTRFVSVITTDGPTGLWLYGILAFQRGIGNVASGPLSAFLLSQMNLQHMGDMEFGYRHLVWYVGAALLAATSGGLGFFWRKYTVEGKAEMARKASTSGSTTS